MRVKKIPAILDLSAISLLFITVLCIAGFTATAQQPKFAGLSPEAAAREMILPPGFKATLFAGEPDVMQPIAFAIDDRGRLWVAEGYTYPNRAKEGEGRDRSSCSRTRMATANSIAARCSWRS